MIVFLGITFCNLHRRNVNKKFWNWDCIHDECQNANPEKTFPFLFNQKLCKSRLESESQARDVFSWQMRRRLFVSVLHNRDIRWRWYLCVAPIILGQEARPSIFFVTIKFIYISCRRSDKYYWMLLSLDHAFSNCYFVSFMCFSSSVPVQRRSYWILLPQL